MARIKKKGLDYFPFNTDFIHDRAVRRLMKREGDSALSILVEVLSYIYAGEGYYVRADRLFYEDLSAGLYESGADDVERIIRLAVEYGLFDAGLFEQCCILTSVEIQRQYLFSTRRRTASHLEPTYCLLTNEEMTENQRNEKKKQAVCSAHPYADGDGGGDDNVTFIPENATSGTHSTEQHSKAEQSKKYPLLSPPLKETGEEMRMEEEEEIFQGSSCGFTENASAGGTFGISSGTSGTSSGGYSIANGTSGTTSGISGTGSGTSATGKRRKWTQEMIDALLPPTDGMSRNYAGLLDNLRSYGIPPSEQYAIIRKSNFGVIGGEIWKGIATLRGSGGKIKLPGRYLLSVVNKTVGI